MEKSCEYLDLAKVPCSIKGKIAELPHFHHGRDRNDGIQNFLVDCICELGTKINQDFKILKDEHKSHQETIIRKNDTQLKYLLEVLDTLRTLHQNLDYLKSRPINQSNDLKKILLKDFEQLNCNIHSLDEKVSSFIKEVNSQFDQLFENIDKIIVLVKHLEGRLETL